MEQQISRKYDHRGKNFSIGFFGLPPFSSPSLSSFLAARSPPPLPPAPTNSHRINQQKKGKGGGESRKQLRRFGKSQRIRHQVEQDSRRSGAALLVPAGRRPLLRRGSWPAVGGCLDCMARKVFSSISSSCEKDQARTRVPLSLKKKIIIISLSF